MATTKDVFVIVTDYDPGDSFYYENLYSFMLQSGDQKSTKLI